MNNQATLYNVEIYNGKTKLSTPFRNIQYAVAVQKRIQLMATGTLKRNIWIVKAN